ncbi:MAG: Mobile element protein [Edaphobacter sp.]|nr:Mobile element protein [Edaphobacter sp.]
MAFVSVEFRLSERTSCKLLGMERSSYRYEPRPDCNIALREELAKLTRQKPRYGYRRLHALLERRGYEVNVKRVYRLYAEEGLAVRRRKRKRLVRDRALEPRLIRPNQEWAASVPTVRSTTRRRRSSGRRQAMWKTNNASHIRTASTTTVARQSQSNTKTGKLQLSVDEKSGAGQNDQV